MSYQCNEVPLKDEVVIEVPSLSYAYGACHFAARYCGFEEPPHVPLGQWQHGWLRRNCLVSPKFVIWDDGKADPEEHHWVIRKDLEEYLTAHDYPHVRAIGASMNYIERPPVKRLKDSLLVMPSHSLFSSEHDWDADLYVKEILAIRDEFDAVAICVHPACQQKGYWLNEFKEAGFEIIEGARFGGRYALERMAWLMCRFEHMTTNFIGTNLGYACYFGCKPSIYGTFTEPNPDDWKTTELFAKDAALLDEWVRIHTSDNLKIDFPFFFVHPREAEVRVEYGEKELGKDCMLSPADLAEAFCWPLGKVHAPFAALDATQQQTVEAAQASLPQENHDIHFESDPEFYDWYRQAQEGDAVASWMLSLCYRFGVGLNFTDASEASYYLREAAMRGLPEAQFSLASSLLEAGGEEARDEALQWLRLANRSERIEADRWIKALSAELEPAPEPTSEPEAEPAPEPAMQEPTKETAAESEEPPRPGNFTTGIYWGPSNHEQFHQGLQLCMNTLAPEGIYSSDNLFTFGRQLGFLRDPQFLKAWEGNIETDVERGIAWRTHVVCWAAENGLRREGDFVECGCYKGVTARIVCDYLDFGKTDKHFYLYDLFEHEEGMAHHAMPEHGQGLYEQTQERFADLDNVHIVRGYVPDTFEIESPKKISFLHIDMNQAPAEVAALEALWDRVVPGGIILLDDYGWGGFYIRQKFEEDKFFARYGYKPVELPTGQGMILK